eukprot:5735643-Amphidinium_carterae.1
MPSVYGQSSFRFLEQTDAITVCDGTDYHQQIARVIQEKVLQEKRAIIVFFRDGAELKKFRASPFCAKLPPCDVLEEKLTDDQKEHIIKKAANIGQIVLATAIFGRGSDFACYDDKLQQK